MFKRPLKRVVVVVVVLGFHIPPTAKVIGRWASVLNLIQKTGEARNQTHNPWFTRGVALPLRHKVFSLTREF